MTVPADPGALPRWPRGGGTRDGRWPGLGDARRGRDPHGAPGATGLPGPGDAGPSAAARGGTCHGRWTLSTRERESPGTRGGHTGDTSVSRPARGPTPPLPHVHRSETCPRVGPRHGHHAAPLLPAAGRGVPKTGPRHHPPPLVRAAKPRYPPLCPPAAAEEEPGLAVCPQERPSRSKDVAPAPAASPSGSRASMPVTPAPRLQWTDSE